MQYNASNLLVHPSSDPDAELVLRVTPESAGWDYINFEVRRLQPGATWQFDSGEHELAIVMLRGQIDVESNHGSWSELGGRESVFEGPPHALYLPRRTQLTATGRTDSEFAVAWVAAEQDFAPKLVTPADVNVEIRGGDNATRQINDILPPGFPCQRLVIVEVYTPSGGWSSYPPHKHDIHKTDDAGNVVEADLEEVYFFKIDRPEGYAYQRVYTAPESPLHRAGTPIDEVLLVRNNEAVLVPEGYHPVTSPPGYTTYYLNILAGSSQSLANSDDPQYAWVKDSYTGRDPRVPIYEVPQRTAS